jgi:hypothetical protein
MNLRKFDACPNYCILYRGEQYEKLEGYPHCGVSRYKRNAGCHVDVNDDGALSGPKKKGSKKKGAKKKQISSQ